MLLNSFNDTLISQNLTYKINTNTIFKKINFTLIPGTIILIKGPNGSGKSTLLKTITGLINSYFILGQLFWNTNLIFNKNYLETYQTQLSYINTNKPLYPNLTIIENLKYFTILYKNLNKVNILNILLKFGLYNFKNKFPNILSLGQLKKIQILKLDVFQNSIWILDEPTLGLDYNALLLLEQIIIKHQLNGGILIVTSHNNLTLNNTVSITLK